MKLKEIVEEEGLSSNHFIQRVEKSEERKKRNKRG